VRALTHELDARRGVRADTDAGELHIVRGGARLAGQLLDLSPTSLAVLRVLAQAGGSVVTREQLLVALPGHSSNGHAVEMAVARLRQAMAPHDLVSTIVKRGYRLRVRPEGAIAR